MFDPPLSLNPLPAAEIVEIVTLALPVSVSVTSCAVDVPTATLPKFTLVVLADRVPKFWVACCKPVPDNAIVSGEFEALLAIERLPCTPPTPVGSKYTDTVAD